MALSPISRVIILKAELSTTFTKSILKTKDDIGKAVLRYIQDVTALAVG